MKKIIPIVFIISFSYLPCSQAQFQFVSPMPGSAMNSTERDIIIRPGSIIEATSIKDDIFTIQGSKSGNHKFTTTFCHDNKTILLHPTSPFAYNEEVSISIGKGLQSVEGRDLDAYSYSFRTHREYTAEEKQYFKTAKDISRMEQPGSFADEEISEDGEADTRDISGLFTITTNNAPAPGDVFFDAFNSFLLPNSWTGYYVITANGDSVYGKTLDYITDFKMVNNGNFGVRNGDEDRYEELDSNFNKINNIYSVNGYPLDEHELQITPDRHVFIIADDIQIVDMTVYNPNYSSHATVTGAVIQEFDADGNLIFEWRSFDHVAITEAVHVNLGSSLIDYIHTNAIEVDDDGNILVSHRHLDQITKIDVNTGDFIWRMGGQLNEFTFINDNEKFCWQHDIRRLDNGNITLWDNGNYHQPPHSTAKEYQLDEVNKTATLVWSYGHPGSGATNLYYTGGGSVQRLSNGNTFINGGWRSNNQNPSMFEVTTGGTIVWEMKLDATKSMTSYRAHKYEWSPCARVTYSDLKTKNITGTSAKLKWTAANGVVKYKLQYKKHSDNTWINKMLASNKLTYSLTGLELNTKYDWRIETWCNTTGTIHSGYTEIKKFTTLPQKVELTSAANSFDVSIFPNPAHDQITIDATAAVTEIHILDLLGREVMTLKPGEQCQVSALQVSIASLPAGNYLVEVMNDQQQQVRKLVVE